MDKGNLNKGSHENHILFSFLLSLLIPFLLITEMISKTIIEKKTGKPNSGVELLPVSLIHLFLMMLLFLSCWLIGDFSPIWNMHILVFSFGLIILVYALSFVIGATATWLIEYKENEKK